MNDDNCNSKDNYFDGKKMYFDHLYDREQVNTRLLILMSMLSDAQNLVTVTDICIVMYDIDVSWFYLENDTRGLKHAKIELLMSSWLAKNKTIEWILTCAAVDDLIRQDALMINERGALETIKNNNQY